MLVKAECQQEVEAAHPAPTWGAVEAKCQQEAEAVQAGKMVLKTEADGIPSFMVSFW